MMGRALRLRTVAVGIGVVTACAVGVIASDAAFTPNTGPLQWTLQFGTSAEDHLAGVATTSNGDVYAAGSTKGSLSGLNAGGWDGWVARYDKSGKRKWIRQFGTVADDYINGIDVSSSGDIYLSGSTNGTLPLQTPGGDYDAFLVRYDKNGVQKWIRQFGTTSSDAAAGVAVRGSDIYVGGATDGTLGASPFGGLDGFLARYDKSGNRKWIQQFGTSGEDEYPAWDIAISSTGSYVYVVGDTKGSYPTFTNPSADQDGALLQFSKTGTLNWVRQLSTSLQDGLFGVVTSGSNEVYVSGYTHGVFPTFTGQDDDGIVARYDKTGTQVWFRQYGSPGEDAPWPVTLTTKGKLVTSGDLTSPGFSAFPVLGGTDAFVARFDKSTGAEETVRGFGTPQDDHEYISGVTVAKMPSGAVVVGGATKGSLWGFTNAGDYDVYMTVFVP